MRMRAQFFIILCRKYLSNEMERLQKRALGIIQPDLSYAEALVALDVTSLYERRKALSNALFDQIVRVQSHKLQSTSLLWFFLFMYKLIQKMHKGSRSPFSVLNAN